MTLSLGKIKSSKGNKKAGKRLGRGNSSGKGTYSSRGLKGQKARSGVSGLKRLGMRQVLLRTPKKRGFISLTKKDAIINFEEINKNFKEGETINPAILIEKGIIKDSQGVKILGNGKLEVAKLKIENIKVSASARDQIEKMDGKIVS